MKAKVERLNQLESRLTVKALTVPAKGAALSSSRSTHKMAPPSPPSMEKKKPQVSGGAAVSLAACLTRVYACMICGDAQSSVNVHDNTTVIMNRLPGTMWCHT